MMIYAYDPSNQMVNQGQPARKFEANLGHIVLEQPGLYFDT